MAIDWLEVCDRIQHASLTTPTPRTDVLRVRFFPCRIGDFSPDDRRSVRRRQWLTLTFALVLVIMACAASAQSPPGECSVQPVPSVQYDGATWMPIPHAGAVVDSSRTSGGTVALRRDDQQARPTHAELLATLANFDADADPDGWRAEVTLRDRDERLVARRAHASFELMPRVPLAYHVRGLDADAVPIRWSVPLKFDDDSVARVKLPLRHSLRPMLGWSTDRDWKPWRGGRLDRAGFGRRRTFVTTDIRALIGAPSTGEMRVRVSVPGEGVFEAVALVSIRPSMGVRDHE